MLIRILRNVEEVGVRIDKDAHGMAWGNKQSKFKNDEVEYRRWVAAGIETLTAIEKRKN